MNEHDGCLCGIERLKKNKLRREFKSVRAQHVTKAVSEPRSGILRRINRRLQIHCDGKGGFENVDTLTFCRIGENELRATAFSLNNECGRGHGVAGPRRVRILLAAWVLLFNDGQSKPLPI